ncbi:MAG TPA: isoprenylcysteine carboxylmethyltransferase family protein [Terriglobales bacterium]|nr:isoprenylcysteine carboxylmethyltransferase family protein [Terriglobales bacterium]
MKQFPVNILLTIVVGVAAFFAARLYAPRLWGPQQLFGLVLLILGFVFWTVARFQLGSSLTVTAQARKLVNTGIYSKIRNPIYVFGSCFLAGLILIIARPIWLLAFVIIVPLQIWRAGKEAKVLEASFGDEYRSYRAGTWF